MTPIIKIDYLIKIFNSDKIDLKLFTYEYFEYVNIKTFKEFDEALKEYYGLRQKLKDEIINGNVFK